MEAIPRKSVSTTHSNSSQSRISVDEAKRLVQQALDDGAIDRIAAWPYYTSDAADHRPRVNPGGRSTLK